MSKAGDTLGTIKARMYTPALAALREKGNPRLTPQQAAKQAGYPHKDVWPMCRASDAGRAAPRHPLLLGLLQTSGGGPGPVAPAHHHGAAICLVA
ncbi:hypothetical protein ABZV61_10230 [Streptomyces sp900116325]|uniref:Uncharacterized protein n=1 Tax=Streptomyces sp. 900116325 TaxID=3154295 RepID=A0ABV2U5N9_9ACTN